MGRVSTNGSVWGLSHDDIDAIDFFVSGGRADTPYLVNLKRVLVRRGLIRNMGSRKIPHWVRVDPQVAPQAVSIVQGCIEHGDDTGGLYVGIEPRDRLDALYVLRNRGLIYQTKDSWYEGWAPR